MYKKLQRKIWWGSSAVLLLVIALVTGIVYRITSHMVTSQADIMMNLILENEGEIPALFELNPDQETFLALNAESIYETRFISAKITGSDIRLISTRSAVVSKEDAVSLVTDAAERKSNSGQIRTKGRRTFHYEKRIAEDGSVMVVLLDFTSRYAMLKIIMMYMASLWMVVLILYVFVMAHFSKKLIAPFVENDERQKRFITNASHELKTPLAVISANTEMMEAMGGRSKWTESTTRQTRRMTNLIEDLVVLTRLDEMKESDMSDVNLSETVRDISEPFRSPAENRGLSFSSDIPDGIHVKGDKRSFGQVTSILLDNAVKYCDDKGSVSVKLSAGSRGKGANIIVSNTYAEGKDVDTSRFFERFYREDESHNSEKAGFGIGLSMAREITERMKGKIKVSYFGDMIYFTVEL